MKRRGSKVVLVLNRIEGFKRGMFICIVGRNVDVNIRSRSSPYPTLLQLYITIVALNK